MPEDKEPKLLEYWSLTDADAVEIPKIECGCGEIIEDRDKLFWVNLANLNRPRTKEYATKIECPKCKKKMIINLKMWVEYVDET